MSKRSMRLCRALAGMFAACLGGIGAGQAQPAKSDLIGEMGTHVAKATDTLLDIARDSGLGYVEIVAANPELDPWLPGEGARVTLPTAHVLPAAPRQGMVVNLGDFRLYYFPADGAVSSFPIGIGREAGMTPLGETRVAGKRVNPVWIPPPAVRADDPGLPLAVAPGPNNPLGAYSLDLAWEAFRIHGTNRPFGVGRAVSYGCIRLYPEDIERLFPKVPVGTPVYVVDQAVKTGWSAGQLYLEVHPNRRQSGELEATGKFTPQPPPGVEARVRGAAGNDAARVDWSLVRAAASLRQGIPVRVTR
jgi:L,D-transpeptidase ErfK/SrfK